MKPARLTVLAAGLLLTSALPTFGQEARATLEACLAQRIDNEAQMLNCVTEALSPCLAEPDDMNSVAALCFRDSRRQFDQGLSARMVDLRGQADDTLVTLVSIELKYDIFSGLLQCDRLEELARALSEISQEAVQRQKAQCQATTSGLALARLQLRSIQK